MSLGEIIMSSAVGLFFFFGVIGIIWAIVSVQKKEKVAKVIITSKIYSVTQIARIVGISESETIKRIQGIISDANKSAWSGGAAEWRIFRGAYLDLHKMEIILAEPSEKPTMGGLIEKAKKVAYSKLAGQLPKEPWTCPYCRNTNDGEEIECDSCKATRPE